MIISVSTLCVYRLKMSELLKIHDSLDETSD